MRMVRKVTPASCWTELAMKLGADAVPVKQLENSGQRAPRRWGWGTPLKKRTATRSKLFETSQSAEREKRKATARKQGPSGRLGNLAGKDRLAGS